LKQSLSWYEADTLVTEQVICMHYVTYHVTMCTSPSVICNVFDDDSALLQVWHRQDPAGFECTYSLDFKVKAAKRLLLAPDGLTVVILSRDSSATYYSWNHDTTQFHPIDFVDNPVHIHAPTLIEHFPSDRLIALRFKSENTIHLLNVYTGRMYAKILGRGSADMVLIRDGTKLE